MEGNPSGQTLVSEGGSKGIESLPPRSSRGTGTWQKSSLKPVSERLDVEPERACTASSRVSSHSSSSRPARTHARRSSDSPTSPTTTSSPRPPLSRSQVKDATIERTYLASPGGPKMRDDPDDKCHLSALSHVSIHAWGLRRRSRPVEATTLSDSCSRPRPW